MDETKKLLKSFDVKMDPEEASKLQEKTEVSDVSTQLENFSDKGYPQPQNECCFLRLMRRKFGVFQ